MPSVADVTLNGTEIDSAGANGVPVIVKFFAPACGACERTLDEVQAFYEDRPEVMVIGVSTDDSEQSTRALIAEHGVRFPIIIDERGSIAERFGVEVPPRTYVADATGRVRWVGGADTTEEKLIAVIDAL